MRRIQVVIDRELDEWLEIEAASRQTSKSALIRECVRREADAKPFDNGLWRLPTFDAGEPDDSVNHDVLIYGLDRV